MGKNCVICGKPSGIYPLCREHLQMKAEGSIVKCEDCGSWHFADTPCDCKKSVKFTELPTEGFFACVTCGAETNGYAFCRKCYKKFTTDEMLEILNEMPKWDNYKVAETEKKSIVKTSFGEEREEVQEDEVRVSAVIIDDQNKSRCITCGRKTDGLLFCSQCYHKYNKKDLLFRITNCTTVELLDDSYEGRFTCKDGHVVKSKSEREIDNYLFEHGIPHAYEKELPYGAKDNEVLHPDFFLPHYLGKDKHVYIEHWGYNENNLQYTKTKKFKLPIYQQLGITLICTYEKSDTGKIDSVLDRKLNKKFIKENEINYEE